MRIIFLLLCFYANAQDSVETQIGEQPGRELDYEGPVTPIRIAPGASHSEIKDTDYWQKQFQPILEIENFLGQQLNDKIYCPDEIYNKNYGYIRYLFRLVHLSYLYEFKNYLVASSRKFKIEQNACDKSWNSVIQKCLPVSDDMKKFKERSIEYLRQNPVAKLKISSHQVIEPSSLESDQSPLGIAWDGWCENIKDKCHVDANQVQKMLLSRCLRLENEFLSLCSEKDNWFAGIYGKEFNELLKKSNVLRNIDQEGFAQGCLDRFIKESQHKDIQPENYKKIFAAIFQNINEQKYTSYLEGELFLPGALKEFDLKGLDQFLFVKNQPIEEEKPLLQVIPQPTAVPTIEISAVIVPTPELKVEPTPIPTAQPYISYFHQGLAKFNQTKLPTPIEMEGMAKDFKFTEELVFLIRSTIDKYKSRAALTELKKFDKFGSKEAPVRLSFLNFLITTEDSHGLYNILDILGSKFYVLNDWEKDKTPHYIELTLIENVGMWQMTFIPEK